MQENNISLNNIIGTVKKRLTMREAVLIYLIVICSVIVGSFSKYFFTGANMYTTAISMAADGIIVIGMTVVLIMGGIDLAVGSMLSFSVVLAGAAYAHWGINIWLAALMALLASALFGLISGILIGKMKFNPFIATLGIMGVARGLSNVLTEGSAMSLTGVSDAFLYLGRGGFLGVSVFFLIFLVLAVVLDFMLRKTSPMKDIFYTGSNEKAAILSGIDTGNVKIVVYTLSSLFAGLAGVLSLARFGVASPTLGTGAEMRVISACVIGGASLTGGEGTVFGSVLGILMLTIINKGLALTSVPLYWQDLVSGLVLIFAVSIDILSHNKKGSIQE